MSQEGVKAQGDISLQEDSQGLKTLHIITTDSKIGEDQESRT